MRIAGGLSPPVARHDRNGAGPQCVGAFGRGRRRSSHSPKEDLADWTQEQIDACLEATVDMADRKADTHIVSWTFCIWQGPGS